MAPIVIPENTYCRMSANETMLSAPGRKNRDGRLRDGRLGRWRIHPSFGYFFCDRGIILPPLSTVSISRESFLSRPVWSLGLMLKWPAVPTQSFVSSTPSRINFLAWARSMSGLIFLAFIELTTSQSESYACPPKVLTGGLYFFSYSVL